MADLKIQLRIVTPDGEKLNEAVDEVVVPGQEGEMGILAAHQPLLAMLQIGEIRVINQGTTRFFACNKGYVEVLNDQVTVITETLEQSDDIDSARAQKAKTQAEAGVKDLSELDDNFERYDAALQRAVIRINVSGRR